MKYVPHWVVDALMSKKFKCHHCKRVFTHKNVRALGIRESISETNKESFFIELSCIECNKVTFFEMQEMNIIQLSEQVIKDVDTDLDEIKEMDMFQDEKLNKKRQEFLEDLHNDMPIEELEKKHNPKSKVQKTSKITLKDVREVKKVLKPEELKHESFLEMMGIPPEKIVQYRETE